MTPELMSGEDVSRMFQPTATLPVAEVRQFVRESLPLAAVGHSYHIEALGDPAVRASPAFQRFSLIELNELHHQVAALGDLLRLERGDRTALQTLGVNLSGFLQNRLSALQAAQTLPPAVMAQPSVQAMMSLVEQSNRQVSSSWPVLMQTVAAVGAPVPGPLLVGQP